MQKPTLPDFSTSQEPLAFLKALYDVAVQRALPLHNSNLPKLGYNLFRLLSFPSHRWTIEQDY